MPRVVRALALGAAIACAPAFAQDADNPLGGASFATLPQGFALEDVSGGAPFDQPVAVAFAPDGRMFVAEKAGRVWVVRRGQRTPVPLLDISEEVMSQHERGLLGLTLDPDFDENRRIYLSYVVDHDSSGDIKRTDAFARVTRYRVVDGSPDRVDPRSRRVLIGETFATGMAACSASHAPAMLAFGSDGTLLVGTGDGADFVLPDAGGLHPACFEPGRLPASEDIGAFRAQSLESLSGKILRIDPETGFGLPSNPFYTGDSTDVASRVWVLGVRNPFRFAVRPGGSADPSDGRPGTIVAGDVGWGLWEEMNVWRGGENGGWPCWEGPAPQVRYQELPSPVNICPGLPTPDAPVAYWHHARPGDSLPAGLRSRSVIGGDFATGPRYPAEIQGRYFLSEFVLGWMATAGFDADDGFTDLQVFSPNMGTVVQTAFDPTSQALYFVNIGTGRIERLRHAGESNNLPPIASARAEPASGAPPLTVEFTAAGSTDPDGDPLAVHWAFGDGWTATGLEVEHTYAFNGTFEVTATVRDSFYTVSTTLEVRVSGEPPNLTMHEPAVGAAALPGEVVLLRAEAVDPDGSATQISWRVDQVHDGHEHRELFVAEGPEANFMVPAHGARGEVVYYRVIATASDGSNQLATVIRDLRAALPGEIDVAPEATLVARVDTPVGAGNPSMEVTRDGVWPPRGSTDPMLQFDTFDGVGGAEEEWFGIEMRGDESFNRVEFQEGLESDEGGWWEFFRVEVRRDGQWVTPVVQFVLPVYRGADHVTFDRYSILFTETRGDAVRLIGAAGGSERYVSVAELQAFSMRDSAIPPPWTSFEVGEAHIGGHVSYDAGVYTMAAAGEFEPTADAFQSVYRALDGDGAVTARLRNARGSGAVAGLMIRGALSDSARHAALLLEEGRLRFRYRAEPGTPAVEEDAPAVTDGAPLWLRLSRSGTVVSAYVSPDGQRWTPAGVAPVAPGVRSYAALVVAGADGRTATAEFDEVALDPTPAGALPVPWALTAVGDAPHVGGAVHQAGVYRISGSGVVAGREDGFLFVEQAVPVRGSLTARVEEVVSGLARDGGGLMVRAGLDPTAPFAYLLATEAGLRLRTRAEPRGPVVESPGPRTAPPVWIRLVWDGDRASALVSADGDTWTSAGESRVALGSHPRAGLLTTGSTRGRGPASIATFSVVMLGVDPDPAASSNANAAAGAVGIEFGVTVRPSPARARSIVELGVDRPGLLTLELLDVLGRRVHLEERTFAIPALVAIPIDVARLPAGTYVARVLSDGRQATHVFVVAR